MVRVRDHISDNHRRASRMLGFALHADSTDIWLGIKAVWIARLTIKERAALAYSALSSLNNEQAELVFMASAPGPVMPGVPLLSAMDEASFWADMADYPSIKACTLAGYNRMTANDQDAFLDHVTRRVA